MRTRSIMTLMLMALALIGESVAYRNYTVHIVCHSHDDVGWLNTLEQYFYKMTEYRGRSMFGGVHLILTTVVDGLLADPRRTFAWSEIKFFQMWWDLQTARRKEQVKELVNAGQLEIVNGGYSSTDEACPDYEQMINNYQAGRTWIEDKFGPEVANKYVKTAWQLDPFGHSRTLAKIVKGMQYESLFFARADQAEKNLRTANRTLEFMWDLGADTSPLFTHMFQRHYSAPAGFNVFMPGQTYVTDEQSPVFNGQQAYDDMLRHLQSYRNFYNSSHLMVLFGDDFMWENAQQAFFQLDAIVEMFRRHNREIDWQKKDQYNDVFFVKYSTPAQYAKAVQEEMGYHLDNRTGDLFPYRDDVNLMWTGYFTTRANLKRQIRIAQSVQQAASKLFALRNIQKPTSNTSVTDVMHKTHAAFREELAILTHHDAVSGTSKQHVANDYLMRLLKAEKEVITHYEDLIGAMFNASSLTSWTWVNQSLPVVDTVLAEAIEKHKKEALRNTSVHSYQMAFAIHNPSHIALSSVEVPLPAEILQGSQEVVLEVFAENTRSRTGFKPASFDVFCSLDFQHVDEQAAANKYQKMIKPPGNHEWKEVDTYKLWEQLTCKLNVRGILVRGWDVLTVYLNVTHVNASATPEHTEEKQEGHGRRLAMTLQQQIRAALRKAQMHPLNHTLYHSAEKKDPQPKPNSSGQVVSTEDLVKDIKKMQQQASVPITMKSGPQIVANASQVRNSLDAGAQKQVVYAPPQPHGGSQQQAHQAAAPAQPQRPAAVKPAEPAAQSQYLGPPRRDPPSVIYDDYNSSSKDAFLPRRLQPGDFLNSSNIKLIFTGVKNKNSTLAFTVEQNQTSPDFRLKRVILPLHLQLGAYLHPNDVRMVGKPAGHYVSKPVMHNPNGTSYSDMYLLNYTQFQNGTISKNNRTHGGLMNFYFALHSDVRNQECLEGQVAPPTSIFSKVVSMLRQFPAQYSQYNYYQPQTPGPKCARYRRVQVQVELHEEPSIDDAIKATVEFDSLPDVQGYTEPERHRIETEATVNTSDVQLSPVNTKPAAGPTPGPQPNNTSTQSNIAPNKVQTAPVSAITPASPTTTPVKAPAAIANSTAAAGAGANSSAGAARHLQQLPPVITESKPNTSIQTNATSKPAVVAPVPPPSNNASQAPKVVITPPPPFVTNKAAVNPISNTTGGVKPASMTQPAAQPSVVSKAPSNAAAAKTPASPQPTAASPTVVHPTVQPPRPATPTNQVRAATTSTTASHSTTTAAAQTQHPTENAAIPTVPWFQMEHKIPENQTFISIEVVVLFSCPLIPNNGTFYTDSNSLDLIRRDRRANESLMMTNRTLADRAGLTGQLQTNQFNGVSFNYYPVTSAIVINGTTFNEQETWNRFAAQVDSKSSHSGRVLQPVGPGSNHTATQAAKPAPLVANGTYGSTSTSKGTNKTVGTDAISKEDQAAAKEAAAKAEAEKKAKEEREAREREARAKKIQELVDKERAKAVVTQLAVVTERSQGGSSLRDGTVELMQQRRFATDDEKGIGGGDTLQEREGNLPGHAGIKVSATYYIKLGQYMLTQVNTSDSVTSFRILQQRTRDPPQVFVNLQSNLTLVGLSQKQRQTFKPNQHLEPHVRLWTSADQNYSMVLRLENLSDNKHSQDIFLLEMAREMWKASNRGTVFAEEAVEAASESLQITVEELALHGAPLVGQEKDLSKVSLSPMQLRTFRLSFKDSEKGKD